MCEVGVPWTPTEFFKEAVQLEHPFQAPVLLPDRVLASIFTALVRGPAAVAQHRREWVQRWRLRSEELAESEQAIHEAAHMDVQPFLKGNNIL
eukprot:6127538-Heterocapsa_arctica.AAC.1